MEKIQILLSAEEKNKFAAVSERLGFTQTQLALLLVYSLVEMYKKRGSFVLVDLEQPLYNTSNSRDKRVQVVCPADLKYDIEKINKELGYSQAQLGLIAIQSFISSYEKSGVSMLSDVLSPEYRVKKSDTWDTRDTSDTKDKRTGSRA